MRTRLKYSTKVRPVSSLNLLQKWNVLTLIPSDLFKFDRVGLMIYNIIFGKADYSRISITLVQRDMGCHQ
jgi:hypothetical protein